MTDIFDPSELAALAELVDPNAVAETDNYSSGKGGGFRPTGPGEFDQPYRTVRNAVRNDDGSFSAELELGGGLVGENGQSSDTTYPLRTWISSRPFSPDGSTGSTSSLAEYFHSVGISPVGQSTADLVRMLPDTLGLPARVYVTWTDKKEQINGEWVGAVPPLKARDFIVGGDKKNPIYSPTITIKDKTYRAKSKVSRFVRSNA
jgi:hypothetical protein